MTVVDRAIERFWSQVDVGEPDECWEWRAAITDGRGKANFAGKTWLAHRLAFFLSGGSIEFQVNHHCDNQICCNPNHLYCGTQRDNMRDKFARGRHLPGRTQKLSDDQVVELRERVATGETIRSVAQELGIHDVYAAKVVRGEMRASAGGQCTVQQRG